MIGDKNYTKKVANVIRRLGTCDKVDIVNTVLGLQRLIDVHALAAHIENPVAVSLNEAEAKRIWTAGYTRGVQDTENKQHGVNDFIGVDGKPTWQAVALFLQCNKHRLPEKHHEFVDDMASRTVWDYEPSEKQHKYLHSLFFKLGGKLT
jgi:hypothetical protein